MSYDPITMLIEHLIVFGLGVATGAALMYLFGKKWIKEITEFIDELKDKLD